MKIRRHNSLAVAEKVIKEMELQLTSWTPDVKDYFRRNAHLECFDNCREQGFVLVVHTYDKGLSTKRFAFAENRNSDDIVVYAYNDTSFPSNLPSDSQWKNKKTFRYDRASDAADYIIGQVAFIAKTIKKEEVKK